MSANPECPLPADFIMKKFGLSRTSLWRWRKAGLPCQSVGAKLFLKESDVARFIADQDAKTKGIKEVQP